MFQFCIVLVSQCLSLCVVNAILSSLTRSTVLLLTVFWHKVHPLTVKCLLNQILTRSVFLNRKSMNVLLDWTEHKLYLGHHRSCGSPWNFWPLEPSVRKDNRISTLDWTTYCIESIGNRLSLELIISYTMSSFLEVYSSLIRREFYVKSRSMTSQLDDL